MVRYKIRNRETGLFSAGGYRARFSREGKTWESLKNLKAHLRLNPYPSHLIDKLEVVEGTFIPTGTAVTPLKDLP